MSCASPGKRLNQGLGEKWPIFVSIIFLTFTLLSFGFYYKRTLQSDINYHILSGEMFGIPSALREKGIKSLYKGPGQTGWDGQFYYFMANDLLATKDTPGFIDHPAYRYQRIGMSLFAAIISRILGNDWVSPSIFLVSYLSLVLLGTWSGSLLFKWVGLHPALILFWSLSVGTQITLFNALPDAAADSFLLLSLYLMSRQRIVLSILPLTFAALSREIYALFPGFIFLAYILRDLKKCWSQGFFAHRVKRRSYFSFKSYYVLLLPCLFTVIWHGYVALHFTSTQKIKPAELLGVPFVSWWKYISSGYLNRHLLVGSGFGSLAEANCLLFFMLVLVATLFVVIRGYLTSRNSFGPIADGIAWTAMIFIGFYASFGSLVIFHYTGYLKALSVFFLMTPLLCKFFHQHKFLHYFVIPCMFLGWAYSTYYNFRVRILPDFSLEYQTTNMDQVQSLERQECFQSWQSELTIKGISIMREAFPWNILGTGDKIIADVGIKNTSPHVFRSTRAFGSVHLGYQWELAEGKTLNIQKRTAFLKPLFPGESIDLKIISPIPSPHDNAVMKVSLVQEGCAWFYQLNPQSQGQTVISVSKISN